ncbi:type IV pilus twitching motility protein PilT [Clostridium cellulovorans]|uniref:Twitching motility protein n=1 Tax=Clostridium cellulovorans (strain ATCC 35296 / DSM 3052 / OCM 3 / 743B) TaxID=573061 RepID=D9SL70_CLOC7|nr:type IV pilus twitching motility protein PilT [Clostridium cellulovorans]ADL51586.1 twitching motility protein [Clostridium cellulovorans 743B]
MDLNEMLNKVAEKRASDLHLTVGVPPMIRVNGELTPLGSDILKPDDTKAFTKQILGDESYEKYIENGEIDISYSMSGTGRYRVNIYKQRGSDALALRSVGLAIPSLKSLEMPSILTELSNKKRGLVLITGPTGSGKTTTLAAMINEINASRAQHIITLEDPIEYMHKHNKCIVNQREIGKDSKSYADALRAVLREDPDVILIGEMRDLETISIAITAAETGHLVLSTLHTIGAAKTIDRIIDVFPPHQQQQVRVQLSAVLQGVVSQQLVPTVDGNGRVAALETMIVTPGIQNLIREGRSHQIQSSVQTGSKYGMKTMDMSIVELYKKKIISYETAMLFAVEKDMVERMITL